MTEKEILKEAGRMFYKFVIIPEATEQEKEYNKHIFDIKGRPEEYPTFYNKCMVKRYKIYNNSFCFLYCDPVTLYTISQLQTYITIQKAIEEAENNADFSRADDLYIRQESFINSIRPPEVYTA